MNQTSMRILSLLFLLSTTVTTESKKHHKADHHNSDSRQWDSVSIDWDESLDAFVPFPKEVLPIVEKHRRDYKHTPLLLDISTSVLDWEQPIYALIKGIVHRMDRLVVASHHFFVQDGQSAFCRTAAENEEILNNLGCTHHCTNHGRYCLGPAAGNTGNPPAVSGAEAIQEAARRMCIGSSLRDDGKGNIEFWKYMDGFQQAQCQKVPANMTDCSLRAIYNVPAISDEGVAKCLQVSGGFEADKANSELDEELDHQVMLSVEHPEQLPVLEMVATPYTGHYATKEIFQTVCAAFPPEAIPLACQFCQACTNVRKCLWHLECDGKSFNATDYASQLSASTSSIFKFEKFIGKWEVGFIWGAVAGLVVAVLFAVREIRIRRLVRKLADVRDFAPEFRPHGGEMPDLDEIMDSLDTKSHNDHLTTDSSDESISSPSRAVV